MRRVVSATEARIRFGELMRWVVENQEPVIVERGGKPHVVVLSIAEYRRLLAGQQAQEDWKALVQQAREQIRAELGERELTPPEEIIRQMREERDAQLLAMR
ncbi:MAG TPA: type II toxin-antitoxin system Phd/YefM family antitoxin [Caldilineae bacterium]|jgi:prevent-host-death family protein|nr:type II toxin-antitoxin system Phd/YefM family antitoxin [Caldilineae bacterium]